MHASNKVEQQKETAFRAAFARGDEINVYGPISVSVMRWGIDRGYAERVGDTSVYRITDSGRRAVSAGMRTE
jgi:hypothetical protein